MNRKTTYLTDKLGLSPAIALGYMTTLMAFTAGIPWINTGFPLSDAANFNIYNHCPAYNPDLEGSEQIYFIEARGKDISFDRWRVCLYYRAGFAKTMFFYTASRYKAFLEKYNPLCFQDYEELKRIMS